MVLVLEKKLLNAKKGFYALIPRWLRDVKKDRETKYKVIYWLNPMEQDICQLPTTKDRGLVPLDKPFGDCLATISNKVVR